MPPPVPGWAKTSRPLRIAIIGWAWLALQGREGSGYNLNCSELARGLVLSGHEVRYLQSGMAFKLGLFGSKQGPFVRHREDWAGVKCYEVVNSPNLAPAFWNFSNVEREQSDPTTAQAVCQWLERERIDIVHIHSQEGYGLDLIPAIRASGRPVIATLHNYWFICPQVDLLYKEESVCTDYAGGERCVGCLPEQNTKKLRRAKAMGDTLEYLLGMYPADVVRKIVYGLKPFTKSAMKGKVVAKFKPKSLTPHWLIDEQLADGFNVDSRRESDPGVIRHDYSLEEWEEPKDYAKAAWDTNERMLTPEARIHHLKVVNNYGKRRHKGVEALNAANLVTAPSDYLRRVHVAMGVEESRTRWVKLGQPHFDQIHRIAKRSPFYGQRPWDPASATRPLRFCFMGTTRANKGLEVLTRAIPLLAPEVRRRCHITIHAAGFDWSFRKRLSQYPEVSVYGAYDLYQLIAKGAGGGEYDVGILPHIWLENSPLVLLENLHAGKFVLSSRLGGPVDWMVEPKGENLGNGLLFAGGDEAALAECMRRCIVGDVTIPSAREVHGVSLAGLQSYPAHIAEFERLYRDIIPRSDRQ